MIFSKSLVDLFKLHPRSCALPIAQVNFYFAQRDEVFSLIYTPTRANKQNIAMTSAQSTKQFNDGFYDENWEGYQKGMGPLRLVLH